MNEYVSLIEKCVLLSSISGEAVDAYLRDGSFKIKTYGKNNIIHFTGEVCLNLEVILSGKVTVERIDESGNLMTIADFYSNEILGGNLLFSKNPHYPMTITAKQPAVVLEIKKERLFELFSAILGVGTKNSFTDIVSAEDSRKKAVAYRSFEEFPNDGNAPNYAAAAEGFKECELIAVASFDGERIFEHYSTKSTVNIREVLQGDTALAGKTIELYEPSFFYFDMDNVLCYRPTSRCTLMDKGKSYIIFAKKRKYSDNKPKYISDSVYIYSDASLPYIPFERATIKVVGKDDSFPLTFSDLSGYDFVCSSETQKERFLKVTEQIKNQYGFNN